MKLFHLKKYEFNIFFSYEVISKNVKSLDRSVNLIFKAYLSCNSLVTNKETVLIFFV